MPEFSHEDIKHAIEHANDGDAPTRPVDPLHNHEVLPEAPETPYDGFEAKPPTEEERIGFRAAKDQLKATHRARNTEQDTAPTSRRRGIIAGTTVAGLLLTGVAGYATLRGNNNDRDTAPTGGSDRSASASPKAGETKAMLPVPEFGISASEYARDPQGLPHEFARQLNTLWNTGVTKEIVSAEERYQMSDEDYTLLISEDIDAAFTEKLFVPGWENNPQLVSFADALMKVAHTVRHVRITLYPRGTSTADPFVREITVEDINATANPLSTSFTWYGHDNRDQLYNGHKVPTSDDTGYIDLTWANIGGELKISDAQFQ